MFRRCTATIYPRANFLDVLEGNPDLYGPVWIATTVVVILFLTGTINQYLAHQGKDHFAYDFKLLSGAAGLVYGYTAFVPVGLWGVLKWYGSESANLLECACLYGYANLVWIVVALVSWSPISSKSSRCWGGSMPWRMKRCVANGGSPQLHVCRPRTGFLGNVPAEELVPCTLDHREQDEQDPARCCSGAARWLCDCD